MDLHQLNDISYELQCTSPVASSSPACRPVALKSDCGGPNNFDRGGRYHVFFIHHSSQRDWVLSVIERLESPPSGVFCCTYLDQIVATNNGISMHQAVARGIRSSTKIVFVLSPEFVADTWTCISDVKPVADSNGALIQRDSAVVVVGRCDLPRSLFDAAYVDASSTHVDHWLPTLVRFITRSDDTPMTELTSLSGCTSPSEVFCINPQNGRLLLSVKSRCRCCGREVIDPTLPSEFLAYGIHIQADEYSHVIRHLMSDGKFVCHAWCYNVPMAALFFTVLFCLSVTLAPVIEERILADRSSSDSRSMFRRTGLEFLHGIIVWLCVLAVYLVTIYVAKTKMKLSTYRRLALINSKLTRYNMLASIENLGLVDCNKYYLHFFYYEVQHCLAYLQESIVNFPTDYVGLSHILASTGNCKAHASKAGGCKKANETCTVDVDSTDCDQTAPMHEDHEHVLNGSLVLTNGNLQATTEDLVLTHSGEYLSLLIGKKLERPRRSRHIVDRQCLCQYIEQRVFRLIS